MSQDDEDDVTPASDPPRDYQREYARSIGFPELKEGDPDLCGDGTYHDWEQYDGDDDLWHCRDCPATRPMSRSTGPELGPDTCHAKHPRGVPCHFTLGHEERGQPLHWNGLVGTWTTSSTPSSTPSNSGGEHGAS